MIHFRARVMAFDTTNMLRISFRWRALAQAVAPSGVRSMLVRHTSEGESLGVCWVLVLILRMLMGADLDLDHVSIMGLGGSLYLYVGGTTGLATLIST